MSDDDVSEISLYGGHRYGHPHQHALHSQGGQLNRVLSLQDARGWLRIYLYIHIYMCLYTYIHLHTHTHTHTHTHIYIYIYIYTHSYISHITWMDSLLRPNMDRTSLEVLRFLLSSLPPV